MRAKMAMGALCVLVLGTTAACADREDDDGGRRGVADAGICTPFNTAQTAATDPTGVAAPVTPGGTEAAAFDDCLHRWGYRLARSDDAADLAAQAAVAVCAPVLARWNQSSLAVVAPRASDSAVSLVTGQTNNTAADRYDMAQGKALFYVVQARAGNCAPPPTETAAAAR